MRLIVVVGARPNFIKAGPAVPALRRAGHDVSIVHTGERSEVSPWEGFYADMDLVEPRWYLGIGWGTDAVETGLAMMRLEELFSEERPDAVVAIGDANPTLATALAASKLGIPVMHLEAGLRSGEMSATDEINRIVTDQLSSTHLAPTEEAVGNLSREGVDSKRVHFVGSLVAEVVLRNLKATTGLTPWEIVGARPERYILASIHRHENVTHPERLAHIVAAFESAPLPVLVIAGPRTRPHLVAAGVGERSRNIHLIEPVRHLDMLALEQNAACILTDSAGVAEEACIMLVPCVTVRQATELSVTIDIGANRLVKPETGDILQGMRQALASRRSWPRPARWDELVSERIVRALDEGVLPLAV